MIDSGEYLVLDKENVDILMELTGKTETELRTMYEDGVLCGHVEVFWRVLNRWYNVRVSEQYVHLGMLDRFVRELIEGTIYEQSNVDRRG